MDHEELEKVLDNIEDNKNPTKLSENLMVYATKLCQKLKMIMEDDLYTSEMKKFLSSEIDVQELQGSIREGEYL